MANTNQPERPQVQEQRFPRGLIFAAFAAFFFVATLACSGEGEPTAPAASSSSESQQAPAEVPASGDSPLPTYEDTSVLPSVDSGGRPITQLSNADGFGGIMQLPDGRPVYTGPYSPNEEVDLLTIQNRDGSEVETNHPGVYVLAASMKAVGDRAPDWMPDGVYRGFSNGLEEVRGVDIVSVVVGPYAGGDAEKFIEFDERFKDHHDKGALRQFPLVARVTHTKGYADVVAILQPSGSSYQVIALHAIDD